MRKAYHLRTNEPDSHDVMGGFERFDLDSIYIPERSILMGFVKWPNREGKIISYAAYHCTRADDIIDGNRNGVKGEVVSELELKAEQVNGIISNIRGPDKHEFEVKTTVDYNGSTEDLVKILSGEYIRKGFVRRVLEKVF